MALREAAFVEGHAEALAEIRRHLELALILATQLGHMAAIDARHASAAEASAAAAGA